MRQRISVRHTGLRTPDNPAGRSPFNSNFVSHASLWTSAATRSLLSYIFRGQRSYFRGIGMWIVAAIALCIAVSLVVGAVIAVLIDD